MLLLSVNSQAAQPSGARDFSLFFQGQPITDQTSLRIFEQYVIQNSLPVVLKVSTKTCGPCIMTKKPYQLLAENYASKVLFIELDADNFIAISRKLSISKVPAFIYFASGREQCRFFGSGGLAQLREFLKTQIRN